MGDGMRQIPFHQLMDWALTEYKKEGSIFGVKRLYTHAAKDGGEALDIFGERLELPFGPAAGPHTQLAQNIVASYVAGGRFFELKTVQQLDGAALPVSKPCILAPDECYNVEWSTELYVPQAMDEYIKGWFALKLLSLELGLGAPDGFVFNMSVGYDLAGIKTKKIDDYIEGLKDAEGTEAWRHCKRWALDNLTRFARVDAAAIERFSPRVSGSITLSTLHGCPPEEIERIAAYLLTEKKLHTFVKCNPTLLGYDTARRTLDGLGYDYIAFDDHHFKGDLQMEDAVPMFQRLRALAEAQGLSFGVKLTNTFPVHITEQELPGTEMYLSGRPLFPLSIEVANRLTQTFDGTLRISYSGGAELRNIAAIYDTGIWPITLVTALLKPGGYERLTQIAETLAGRLRDTAAQEKEESDLETPPVFRGIDGVKLQALAQEARQSPLYRKAAAGPLLRKLKKPLPLLDCFTDPCGGGCPFHQDVPAYLRLAGEGKHLEALRVIVRRNPLPFITGTICAQHCADACTRNFYEGAVDIRGVKLAVAEKAYEALMGRGFCESAACGNAPGESAACTCTACESALGQRPVKERARKIAIVGGGPAGLAAAYFLAKAGNAATIFEKRTHLGGVVRHVIPGFRIEAAAIDKDIALVLAAGVEVRLGCEIKDLDALRAEGFEKIILAVGAWKPGTLALERGEAIGALAFLERFNALKPVSLGENVAVIGGGNTAMDAARAALRVPGVKRVSLVYRRTKRYMPADAEELALALKDGAVLHELLSPLSLHAGVLLCARMALGAPDASGRRTPVATGEQVEIPADAVIAAIGDAVDEALYERMDIPIDARGQAVVNADTLETARPGVYVAGDGVRGPATVAEAIGDALRCVQAITGADVDAWVEAPAGAAEGRYAQAERKKGILYDGVGAACEWERCLECAILCGLCADVCPNRANRIVFLEGRPQIIHVDYMCNACGNCETFCPYASAPHLDKFTLFACPEDFDDSANAGFLPLAGGRFRVRLDGKTAETRDGTGIPEELWKLMQAALSAIPIHTGRQA